MRPLDKKAFIDLNDSMFRLFYEKKKNTLDWGPDLMLHIFYDGRSYKITRNKKLEAISTNVTSGNSQHQLCVRRTVWYMISLCQLWKRLVHHRRRSRLSPDVTPSTWLPKFWCQMIEPYGAIPSAFVGIWRSCSGLIETTQRARACFQSEDMRDEFGKSSAALLVPYSPPSPDPVPLCPEVSIRLEAGNVGIPNKGLHH